MDGGVLDAHLKKSMVGWWRELGDSGGGGRAVRRRRASGQMGVATSW